MYTRDLKKYILFYSFYFTVPNESLKKKKLRDFTAAKAATQAVNYT